MVKNIFRVALFLLLSSTAALAQPAGDTISIRDGVITARRATVTAGNALKVDGSAVTQPVSGTVTANAGTNASTANLDVALSTRTKPADQQHTIIDSGTTAVTQGGTLTVQPGNTANTTAWKVDGSGVTQPVSGTVSTTIANLDVALSTRTKPADQQHTIVDSGTAAVTQGGTFTVQPGNTANTTAWKVDGSAVTQPVSGTVTASNANFDVALSTRTKPADQQHTIIDSGTTAVTQGGTITVQPGNTANTTAWKVDGSAVTQPVSGTVTTTPPSNASTNIAQMNGVAVTMGDGVTGTGVQRVTLASDSTGLVKLATGANTIGALTANQSVNAAQINGVTPLMGNGATGTGALRVSIANDSTGVVQPGNTANTTPWLVTQVAATSGGSSIYHLVSAATTNATVVKASAGQVCGWYIYNSNAAARKLVFHNASTTPTAGASVFFALMIPPTSAANAFSTNCSAFSTGIAITTVTDLADSGTTAVGANDLIINLMYK